MAKIIYSLLVYFLLLHNSIDCVSQVYSPCRSAVIKTYKSQIGVSEATGQNDGVQVEKYLLTVGLGKGYAWCAAFVKWSLVQGCNNSNTAQINAMAMSLHKTKQLVYFKKEYTSQPLPGDVFTIYYPALKRIGHTGFFNGWANKGATYYTVEGNTSSGGSREGQGVYLRIRALQSTHSITRWVQ